MTPVQRLAFEQEWVSQLAPVQRFAFEQALLFMDQINHSLQLSRNSTNPDTKVSRLEFAKARLKELELLAYKHQFIKLQRLPEVQSSVAALEAEFSEAGYYTLADESSRDYTQDVVRYASADPEFEPIAWEFCATLQLRTPLRFLKMHRQRHQGSVAPQPPAALWIGIWLPVYGPISADFPEFEPTSMASEIGCVPDDGGDFLKFLIRVRTIVEDITPAEDRLAALRDELRRPEWNEFCRKLGGKQNIAHRFFPRFIETIKGLPAATVETMSKQHLTTPKKIAATPDAELLSIRGIGPAKLTAIRKACEAAARKSSELVDAVER